MLELEVERLIRASPERLFEAWTTPAQLLSWWGPAGVRCTRAEIELSAGGPYCLHNELPDGRVLVIRGVFRVVEPPHRLVYSWALDPNPNPDSEEQVTVRFDRRANGTLVRIRHERIGSEVLRSGHELGWQGCLDGLESFVTDGR